jgi:hypothetical protein
MKGQLVVAPIEDEALAILFKKSIRRW